MKTLLKNVSKYRIFDTDTGIRYNLFLHPKTSSVDLTIDGVQTHLDLFSIEMEGQEALDFWEQLVYHKDDTDANTVFIWEAYNKGKELLEQKK
jgi:hypothetical protein